MADIDSPVELRAWSLGAFHTVGFVLAVVLGVHLSGTLADKLGRLNTAIGVAAFLGLWALTWRITKAALLKMDPPIEDAESGEIVASMIVAGGWNGVAIFAAILLIAFAAILSIAAASAFAPSSQTTTGAGLNLLPILFLVAVLGSLLAFTIGGIVGFVCGAADAALVRAGAALDRWARAGR